MPISGERALAGAFPGFLLCLRASGSLAGPLLGFLLEDERFDEGLGDLLTFPVETGDGLEQEAQLVTRPSLVLVEQQQIGADPKGYSQLAQGIDGRLRDTGLVPL